MKRRLLFLTQYSETGASSRIRIYQFLPYFEAAGFDITVRPLITGDANRVFKAFATAGFFRLLPTLFFILAAFRRRVVDVVKAWSYDAVIVQKDVLPFGLGALLRLGQKNIVYEFDDPIWMGHPSSGKVKGLNAMIAWYRKVSLVGMLKKSRTVIIDNVHLQEFAAQYCPSTIVITSPIDTRKYTIARQEDPLVRSFGWIGSPGTFYMLTQIMPLLEELGTKIKFRLYNIGGLPFQAKNFQVENVKWSIENELRCLSIFDVGLMPIDDLPFNRFKFGYKVVQYFCAGIPTLATDVGLNRVAIEEGKTGLRYKIDDAQDFCAKALKLFNDQPFRHELGRNARQLAEDEYDIRVLAKKFVRCVSDVIDEQSSGVSLKTRLPSETQN